MAYLLKRIVHREGGKEQQVIIVSLHFFLFEMISSDEELLIEGKR